MNYVEDYIEYANKLIWKLGNLHRICKLFLLKYAPFG